MPDEVRKQTIPLISLLRRQIPPTGRKPNKTDLQISCWGKRNLVFTTIDQFNPVIDGQILWARLWIDPHFK